MLPLAKRIRGIQQTTNPPIHPTNNHALKNTLQKFVLTIDRFIWLEEALPYYFGSILSYVCSHLQVFQTTADNQMQVGMRVLQGECEMAMNNKLLCEFDLMSSSASLQHQGPRHRSRGPPPPKTKPTSTTVRQYARNGHCFLHRVRIAPTLVGQLGV